MATGLKLYRVKNNGQNIGTFYAKNEAHALQRAQEGANEGANAFRRSWSRVTFKNLTAERIEIDPETTARQAKGW